MNTQEWYFLGGVVLGYWIGFLFSSFLEAVDRKAGRGYRM